jgi:hypothetical protein
MRLSGQALCAVTVLVLAVACAKSEPSHERQTATAAPPERSAPPAAPASSALSAGEVAGATQKLEPADVVKKYYAAINEHDYARAYGFWGSSGPAGQTPQSFAAGFSDTAMVNVEVGNPSRVEGAAGSRYVDVPVTVTATTKSGQTQRFTGTYTLRQTVVDGAPESDRAWHLYRAAIRRAG